MKQMNKNASFRPTAEAKGYLDELKNIKVFHRSVDAYVFAAAYALKNKADISQVSLRGRSELVDIRILDDEVCLALEAGIHIVLRRAGQPEPADEATVLELVTKYAEAGIGMLRERWAGKTGLQIQDDIRKLIEIQKKN